MESPEQANHVCITTPTTSSPPSSLQVSPLSNYLRNLSPLRTDKTTRYCQRLSQINLPIPLSVFTSPRVDLPLRSSSLTREQSNVEGLAVLAVDRLRDIELMRCCRKEVQSCSPSRCIDEYLAIEVDDNMKNFCSGVDLSMLSKNSLVGHEEPTSEADGTNSGNEKAAVTVPDHTAGDLNSVSTISFGKTAREREHRSFSEFMELLSASNVGDHVDYGMLRGPFSGAQQNEQFFPQAIGGLSFSESFQRVEAHKGSKQISRSLSEGTFKESDQQHRGIRRHLHFEAEIANLCFPACLNTDFESFVPPHAEPRAISRGWQAGNSAWNVSSSQFSFCPSESVTSVQNFGNYVIPACIPSGVDLHSNSIIRSVSMGSDSNANRELASNLLGNKEKQMCNGNNNLSGELDSIIVSSLSRGIYAHVGDEKQESQAAVAAGSASCQSITNMQPSCDSQPLTIFKQQATPSEQIMPSSENIEELNQLSPERKRAKYAAETDGCKRCNCKRSRCLKLYCECFAAGVYCVDSCSCESCFNKPEYEDTVLDMRQQIEARNPLAFAPKVVKHMTQSPAITDKRNWTTPSSGWHKRGCNCKKSKCVKKYCECYQAGVGCSEGCRCEDCTNSFGRKAESIYILAEKRVNPSQEQQSDTSESHSDCTKVERSSKSSSTWEEFVDLGHLTPLSQPFSGALGSSPSDSEISLGQLHQESSLISSPSYFQWRQSPPTPKLYGSGAVPEHGYDSFLHNLLEQGNTPESLESFTTPIKGVKLCSPNQKRVSPPKLRSYKYRPSSSHGLASGRKLNLQDMPYFPPLTPYSKSKDSIHQSISNQKDSNGYQ